MDQLKVTYGDLHEDDVRGLFTKFKVRKRGGGGGGGGGEGVRVCERRVKSGDEGAQIYTHRDYRVSWQRLATHPLTTHPLRLFPSSSERPLPRIR